MISVMLVEADEGLRSSASSALESGQTLSVTPVGSVEEALQLLNSRRFDAIVANGEYPSVNWQAIPKACAVIDCKALIILYSRTDRSDIRINALKAGAILLTPGTGYNADFFLKLQGALLESLDQKHLVAAYFEKADLYQKVLRNLGEGIWVVDSWGHSILANPRMAEMLGYSPAELIAYPLYSFMDDQSVELARENLEKQRSGVEAWRDVKLFRKDGSLLSTVLMSSTVYDDEGHFIGSMIFVLDTGDWENIELLHCRQDRDFQAIVTKNVDPMVILDKNGIIQFVNPAAEGLFEMSAADLIGQSFGSPVVLEEPVDMYVLRQFKAFVAVEMRMVEVDWAGKPSYLISFRDMTEHILAEDALRKAKGELETRVAERTRDLSESNRTLRESQVNLARAQHIARLGSIVWDLKNGVQRWSDETYSILGLAKANPSYEKLLASVHPEDAGKVRESFDRAISQGQPYDIVFRVMRPDNAECIVHSEAEVMTEGDRPVTIYCVIQDITGQKLAEEALEDAKAQAELYLDLMSHDINNMNQIGIGFLELAMEKLLMNDTDKELLERPLEVLQSSSKLIDNVRKLQRAKAGGMKIEPIDLCSVIDDLINRYSHVPGRDVRISFRSLAGCDITGNILIRDVFSNLMGNAIKHSDPEKLLQINIAMERTSEHGEPYYLISVEDNGPGIPDELKKNLFNRFQRGATKASGRGLGLYLVRTIVEDFHGIVWVEDRVAGDYRQGSRFMIKLPGSITEFGHAQTGART